jgi:hypothetical protein
MEASAKSIVHSSSVEAFFERFGPVLNHGRVDTWLLVGVVDGGKHVPDPNLRLSIFGIV